jgi:hypothetical protein
MTFFTPTEGFTHHARFYGVPCYVKADGPWGMEVAGTNIIFDWLVLHVCPWAHWAVENIRGLYYGEDYESGGWPFLIKGEIPQPEEQ